MRTKSCLIRFAYLLVSFSTSAFSHPPGAGTTPSLLPLPHSYPSNFTAHIRPIPLHSHNDYWRLIPLFSALSVGAISVEADVWAHDTTLYVGHDKASLTASRTFHSLYIAPILGILEARNRGNSTGVGNATVNGAKNGVWVEDPQQTLNLYVDLKTPGEETLPVVVAALQPLREKGYLTTPEKWGAVTVHLTGDTPFNSMLALENRDVFFDAPLTELHTGLYNSTNSRMGTARFSEVVGHVLFHGGEMTEEMDETVRGHVREAHGLGIGVRYWDTPVWPGGVREGVWRRLVELGVDLLNVDDLVRAREFV